MIWRLDVFQTWYLWLFIGQADVEEIYFPKNIAEVMPPSEIPS